MMASSFTGLLFAATAPVAQMWRPMRPNKSFDADAQRRSFASLRSLPLGAGQLRR